MNPNPEQPTPEQHHEVDVRVEHVARVYAQALLNEAWQRGQGQETLEDLQALVGVVDGAPDFRDLLSSEIVSREHKDEVLRKVFDGRASELLTNFLYVLNQHDRLALLRPILDEYRALYDQRQNRVRVAVVSAVPLAEDQLQRIREGVRQVFGQEAVLEPRVDPDMIGGLQVQVVDWLFDGSVRTSLDALRTQLKERGSHEIQSGRDRFSYHGRD